MYFPSISYFLIVLKLRIIIVIHLFEDHIKIQSNINKLKVVVFAKYDGYNFAKHMLHILNKVTKRKDVFSDEINCHSNNKVMICDQLNI